MDWKYSSKCIAFDIGVYVKLLMCIDTRARGYIPRGGKNWGWDFIRNVKSRCRRCRWRERKRKKKVVKFLSSFNFSLFISPSTRDPFFDRESKVYLKPSLDNGGVCRGKSQWRYIVSIVSFSRSSRDFSFNEIRIFVTHYDRNYFTTTQAIRVDTKRMLLTIRYVYNNTIV